jgi:hypothetical protein
MTEPKHVPDARQVLRDTRNLLGGMDYRAIIDRIVTALSDAGLLRTDLHERALKACEDFAHGMATSQLYRGEGPAENYPGRDAFMVGRESLALKQRWTVGIDPDMYGKWGLMDGKQKVNLSPQAVAHFDRKEMAQVAADALNAREYADRMNAAERDK